MVEAGPAFFTILPGRPVPETDVAAVGNKAWNLMRLAAADLPVPPAFVLPTTWWRRHAEAGDAALRQALADGLARIEAATGLAFGSRRRPLLVSVRSGAAISMPGMLETVLNVGLTHDSVEGMIRLTGNPCLAWDSFRRLIENYAEIVSGLAPEPFALILARAVQDAGVASERALDFRALRAVSLEMLACYEKFAGNPFPADPMEQLAQATAAIIRSWDAPKATAYRQSQQLSDAGGTAVTIQTMVFGNAGARSGSGVGFTRDPATGAAQLYFDFCFNGQGEDVVAGRHAIADDAKLERRLPGVYAELQAVRGRLEASFHEAQDFEFTVQEGAFHILQTRTAKRTPWAALQIAVDMVREGLITQAEALRRVASIDLTKVEQTHLAATQAAPLASATGAGPGVASGAIALDAQAVARLGQGGQHVILLRPDTVTDDIAALVNAAGILTRAGSRTSHAAVVARQLGKVCLVGCRDLAIDMSARRCRIGTHDLAEGDLISLDGNEGRIYAGAIEVVHSRPNEALALVEAWRRDN